MDIADKRDTFPYVFLGALLLVALAAIFPAQAFAKPASEYSDQCANVIYPEGAGPETDVVSDSLSYYRGTGIDGGNPVCMVKALGTYVTLEPVDILTTPYGQALIVYHNDTTKVFLGAATQPSASRSSSDAIPFVSCFRVLSDIRCVGNPNVGGAVRLIGEVKDNELSFAQFEIEKASITTPDSVSEFLDKVNFDKPIFLAGKGFRLPFKRGGGAFGGANHFRTTTKETRSLFAGLGAQADEYKIEVALPMKAFDPQDGEYRALSFDKKQLFYMANLMQSIGRQFASE